MANHPLGFTVWGKDCRLPCRLPYLCLYGLGSPGQGLVAVLARCELLRGMVIHPSYIKEPLALTEGGNLKALSSILKLIDLTNSPNQRR